MRFDFNLEKTDWKWNVAHKKKIWLIYITESFLSYINLM